MGELTSEVAINCRGYRDRLTETGAAPGKLSRETLRRAHWPYNRNTGELEKSLEYLASRFWLAESPIIAKE